MIIGSTDDSLDQDFNDISMTESPCYLRNQTKRLLKNCLEKSIMEPSLKITIIERQMNNDSSSLESDSVRLLIIIIVSGIKCSYRISLCAVESSVGEKN